MSPGFHGNTGFEDDGTDIPISGFWPKWGSGVILAGLFLVYGVVCLVTQRAYLPGRAGYGGGMPLQGNNAIALGIACLGVGLFFHCHFFWGNIYHLSGLATLGKIAGLITFIASLGYLIVRIVVYGFI